MHRRAIIDAAGTLHHIICRGLERRKIFTDDIDRNNFVDRIGNILTETKTPFYAWAQMTNHVHLLLRTGHAHLSTVMRRLLPVILNSSTAAPTIFFKTITNLFMPGRFCT